MHWAHWGWIFKTFSLVLMLPTSVPSCQRWFGYFSLLLTRTCRCQSRVASIRGARLRWCHANVNVFDPYREYSFLLSCVRVCLCVCGFLATLSQLLVSATYNVGVTSGTKPSPVWAGTLHVEIKLLGFLLSACQNIPSATVVLFQQKSSSFLCVLWCTEFHQMQLRNVIAVSISLIFFAKLNVNRSALYFTSTLAWTDLARDCWPWAG